MIGWAVGICIAVAAVLLLWLELWALADRALRGWFRLRWQAKQAKAVTRHVAAQQFLDAGIQSLAANEASQALAALDQGLSLLPGEPRLEVSLHFYRGFALERMGQLQNAIAAYMSCQAIYGRLHHELQYTAAVRQGLLLAKLERHQEAEQHLRRTIAALQRAPESASWLQTEAYQVLAGMFYQTQDYARAVEWVQQGARAAHSLRNVFAEARFLQKAGDGLTKLGQPEEALRRYERSLDLYRLIGEGHQEAVVKQKIGLIFQAAGDWDKSLAWLKACLLHEEQEQNRRGQARLCYDLACLRIDQGNLQDAGGLLQRSMSLFRQMEDHEGLDEVGRTLMGLSLLVHRRITASRLTFRDIERGSAKSQKKRD